MNRAFLLAACLASTGCGRTITAPECTIARAGADTVTVVVVNAAGDPVRAASVGWCRP